LVKPAGDVRKISRVAEPGADRVRPIDVLAIFCASRGGKPLPPKSFKEATMRKLTFVVAMTLSLAAGAIGTVTMMTFYPEQEIDTNSDLIAQLDRAAR
jgi:hypothetical protein